MIVKESAAQPVGDRHRDQHHDLFGAPLAEFVEERQDRPDYGAYSLAAVVAAVRGSSVPTAPADRGPG
jgi:hypothetical protein